MKYIVSYMFEALGRFYYVGSPINFENEVENWNSPKWEKNNRQIPPTIFTAEQATEFVNHCLRKYPNCNLLVEPLE